MLSNDPQFKPHDIRACEFPRPLPNFVNNEKNSQNAEIVLMSTEKRKQRVFLILNSNQETKKTRVN